MNYDKLKQFKLWDRLDAVMLKQRFDGERRNSLYPSEASAIAIDPITKKAQVLGGCARKVWYRTMKFEESNPPSVKSLYTFAFGNVIEAFICDLIKQAGIYNNKSVKFWDRSSYVSGEIDIIADYPLENDKYVFIEVKSTWGGQIVNGYEAGAAKRLFLHYEGRGKERALIQPVPKDNNLLQLVTYLYIHKDDPNLLGGKLVYFLRDNCNKTEFDVVLVPEDGKYRVSVNGEIDYSYYAEDIFVRYNDMLQKIKADIAAVHSGTDRRNLTPPERDFSLVYTDDQVEDLYERGKISKTAYNNHYSGKSIGDFQCSYCSYKNLCYNLNNKNGFNEEEPEE